MNGFEEQENQVKHQYQTFQYVEKDKKHGVPALIFFFPPEVGQLIKGYFGKAIMIWLLLFVILLFLFVGGAAILSGDNSKAVVVWLSLAALAVTLFWNVYDAYNSNE